MKYEYKMLQNRIIERFGTIDAFAKELAIPEKRLQHWLQNEDGWPLGYMQQAISLLKIPAEAVDAYFFRVVDEEQPHPVEEQNANLVPFDTLERLSDELAVLEFCQKSIELEVCDLQGYAARLTDEQRHELDNLYHIIGVYHERMRKVLDSEFEKRRIISGVAAR